jgi:hypothetical protein
MKRFIRFVYILTLVLAGCASNKYLGAESTTENTAEVQKQIELVQRKIISCMVKVNQTDNGKFVNANLIALSVNNVNAQKLFHSTDFVTDQQAEVLKKFKEETLQCGTFSKEFPKPEMVTVSEYYFSKVDAVYDDLINKRIPIGIANEERQMRPNYTKEKWAEVTKNYKANSSK